MARLLLIVAGILLVVWLLKRYRKSIDKPSQPTISEDMVRCAHCAVHLPKSESITSQGQFFCCDEHRRLHRG